MKNLVLKVVDSVQGFLLRRLCSELQEVGGRRAAPRHRRTTNMGEVPHIQRHPDTSPSLWTALGRGPGGALPVRPAAAGAAVRLLAAVQRRHAADLPPQARPSQPGRPHEHHRATGTRRGAHNTAVVFIQSIKLLLLLFYYFSRQVPSVASQVARAVAMASLATTCDLLEQQAADRRPEVVSVLVSLQNYFYSPAAPAAAQSQLCLGNINQPLLKPTSGVR